MKKIIVSIVIFTLMSSFALSVTATIPQSFLIKQPIDNDFAQIPGCISPDFPGFNLHEVPRTVLPHHEISLQTTSDEIIDMILQLDGDMVLGYLEDLVSFGPRVTGTIESEQAAAYIYNEFQTMGLDVRYHSWSYSGYEDVNVEGTIAGVNPSSDEIYIICAHYDSVPGTVGADDDGSGVAALMAAAYIMSQYTFNHTIRFVAFSGEEQGLLGSHVYAQEAYANNDNIVAVLNADMIGYAITEVDGNNVKIYEDEFSEWVTDFTDDIAAQYYEYIGLNVIPSGWTWGSDHYSFWEFDYSAIFAAEYHFNPYWHYPEDTIENMNITYYTKTSRLLLATLAEFAQTWLVGLPPDEPTINGPVQGKPEIEYDYTFMATDPDSDRIYYYIEWGDGSNSGWLGPYDSGEEMTAAHSWAEKGTYIIKAKVKDTYNLASDWTTFDVSIPRTRVFTYIFFQRFFERFPNAFPILRQILT